MKKHAECRECAKNGKKTKAIGCYSPDLDIQGLCFCKKHHDIVMYEYIEAIYSDNNK